MIYLLEDDDSIRKLVVYGLQSQGYEAQGFALPSEFWRAMDAQLPELLLLDIMLPEEDGLSILRKLRAAAPTRKLPVIILTAKNTEYDRVVGLDGGADDFISKPFGMMELLARVRAVLRRAEPSGDAGGVQIGVLYICPPQHIVRVNGKNVQLTNKEFEILCLLVENRGIVLTRGTLMDKVWGFDYLGDSRTVDVHIKRLREKLEGASDKWSLKTVWGVGYKIGGRA